MSKLLFITVFGMIGCVPGVEEGTPLPAARDSLATLPCVTTADCRQDEICVGPMGCDTTWSCVSMADRLCTLEASILCTCDGETITASLRCAGVQVDHYGACDGT